jgi:hypothetical protein
LSNCRGVFYSCGANFHFISDAPSGQITNSFDLSPRSIRRRQIVQRKITENTYLLFT